MIEVNEDNAMWAQYRLEQKARRLKRLPIRIALIESVEQYGLTVRQLTQYQYRINDVLDVWPIHNRYHDLIRNRRGGYRDVKEFIIKWFGKENTK